ncbi:hypothetical protein SASPL_137420 [Salvia splendens]|uniref:Uncharacterized protein n=1 Tax=Salvia splendens TaxID=180675 RepID=A0A8X8WUB5_SALSN|nr:hypothetical protein SASPL_137420 [Salvia splendens]
MSISSQEKCSTEMQFLELIINNRKQTSTEQGNSQVTRPQLPTVIEEADAKPLRRRGAGLEVRLEHHHCAASSIMVHYVGGKLEMDDPRKNAIHAHKNCVEWVPNVYFEEDILSTLKISCLEVEEYVVVVASMELLSGVMTRVVARAFMKTLLCYVRFIKHLNCQMIRLNLNQGRIVNLLLKGTLDIVAYLRNLGTLASPTNLILSTNQLTGSRPEELGNLTSLTNLQLGENHLVGIVVILFLKIKKIIFHSLGTSLSQIILVTGIIATSFMTKDNFYLASLFVEYPSVRAEIREELRQELREELRQEMSQELDADREQRTKLENDDARDDEAVHDDVPPVQPRS